MIRTKVIGKMLNHCCCFSLRTGSKIWAVINGFLSLGGFVLGCVDVSHHYITRGSTFGSAMLVICLVMVLCNVLMFIGCNNHQRHFFMPWLILQMIAIVFSYMVCFSLLTSGALALIYSDKIAGDLLLDRTGNIHNKDKYSFIGGLAGISAILASIILLLFTSLLAYFWVVVEQLCVKGSKYDESFQLLQALENPKYTKNIKKDEESEI